VYRDRIVVGVDGSAGSRSALLWAADECQIRERLLLLVHAPAPSAARTVLAGGEPAIRALDEAGRRLLDAELIAASIRQPGVPVTSLLSHAGAADALIDLSAGADMLVVGTRGDSGFTSTMLGSVSTRAAAHSHCPVAVVPEALALRPESLLLPIIVGASSSAAGRLAFEFALAEAQHRGARVMTVCAAQVQDPTGADQAAGRGAPRRQTLPALTPDLQQIHERYPDVVIEPRFVRAEPSEALLSCAHHAQLLVVGCHHSDDHWSTRLGPVASAVLHRSPCPVVVVGERRRATGSPEQDSVLTNVAFAAGRARTTGASPSDVLDSRSERTWLAYRSRPLR
jgi:nucleotide-binding universal stress UspA family protein